VVAPTRELASQVAGELTWLLAQVGARIAVCVGGMDMGAQIRSLKSGAQIVVGTPGRLVDHLTRKSLQLGALEVLVLDEADEMLDLGFREELETLLQAAPKARRTLLFSATLPAATLSLAQSYQQNAERVQATPPRQAHQDIEVRAHLISSREREHAVVNCLRHQSSPSAIVFCATRDHVSHLHASLSERGFAAVALSGELTQPERTRALQALRDGRARVLVATDVAARGLDLPDLGIVIQADLPQNAEVFQHRSGRTGRAGKKGVSVLLVPAGSQRSAERILHVAGVKATWSQVPTADAIRALDTGRLQETIAASINEVFTDDDLALARKLLETVPAEKVAAALVASRRGALPAPEDLPLTALIEPPRAAKGKLQTHPSARQYYDEPEEKPRTPKGLREQIAAKGAPAPPHAPKHAGDHAPRSHPKAGDRAPLHERKAPPHRAPEAAHRPPARDRPGDHALSHGAPRDKAAFAGAVWFKVNVGRSRNADPRWLLPILCRRGGVVKDEIGAIRIEEDATRFQVKGSSARRFEVAAAAPDKKDPKIFITREKK
jgi:ATP-dependent RNA helicase DeaD